MTISRRDLEDAVAAYWGAKNEQVEHSLIRSAIGAGTAGSVRGGRHFDAIATLIGRFFIEAGYPTSTVRLSKSQSLELPGYFRPQKQWDVVVTYGDTLVAAFELKALGGPSFGNNYNNRVEEALGSAIDLRRSLMPGRYSGETPWLGYFFMMQDEVGSRSPVRAADGVFPVEDVWRGKSYQERFGIFCERLLDDGIYDAICYITSSAVDPTPTEPMNRLDWNHFSTAIENRLAYLQERGIPGRDKQLPVQYDIVWPPSDEA